jgi:hypothetical protein
MGVGRKKERFAGMVNRARHNLTESMPLSRAYVPKVGKRQACQLLKVRTLEAIATV